eukprot:TRINITY_DN1567_c0_g1_i7.p1 TRINITY_DN1567_c0_g1~~TRINITY_DN1567_c0_g1_i7.p1  ORF type:complete len:450 (+),score=78.91 TRINITY_DN1567_c0_g1_i7:402-1751(+)
MNTIAAILVLAREFGYTPVPVNPMPSQDGDSSPRWSFTDGCKDGLATFECEFERLGSCSTQTVRETRLAQAQEARSAPEFRELARRGVKTVFLHPVNEVQKHLGLTKVPALAAQLKVPLQLVFSQALRVLMRPARRLQESIDNHSWSKTLARLPGNLSKVTKVALHIRNNEAYDGRVVVPMSRYFDEVDKIVNNLPAGSRVVVAILTDVASYNLEYIQEQVGPKPYDIIFPTQARLLPTGVEAAFVASKKTAVTPDGEMVTPSIMLSDAVTDLMILVGADHFIGTSSNWAFMVLAMRLDRDPLGKYLNSGVICSGYEWTIPPPNDDGTAGYKEIVKGEKVYKITRDIAKSSVRGMTKDLEGVDLSAKVVEHRLPLLTVDDPRLVEYWGNVWAHTSLRACPLYCQFMQPGIHVVDMLRDSDRRWPLGLGLAVGLFFLWRRALAKSQRLKR